MKKYLFLLCVISLTLCCKMQKENKLKFFNEGFQKINKIDEDLFVKKNSQYDTINYIQMDSIFNKYKCTYIDINNNFIHYDFTLENFSEYEIFPKSITNNKHNIWYKVGTIDVDDKNYGLILKMYDIYSSRFFIFIFDKKNNQFKSSIGLYGYIASTSPTEIGDVFSQKKVFMNSIVTGNKYKINIEASDLSTIYEFILVDGVFKLISKKDIEK